MEILSNTSLLILGRQPALGLAELESLYSAANLQPVGTSAVITKLSPDEIDFKRLGGAVKLAEVLATLETTDWNKITKSLAELAPKFVEKMPTGKIHLGISAYDFIISPTKINAGGLTIKKAVTKSGRSVRLAPNKTSELNTASVTHNRLTGPNGLELILVRDGTETIVARTVEVQDITSYTLRDRSRPKRDARVGMLPPKLAQIIINLATPGPHPPLMSSLHDPFCGTGVILQEALLMELDVYGSDIDPRMVEYSKANLDWLDQRFGIKYGGKYDFNYQVDVADATSAKFKSNHIPPVIERVASETYLGRPFTGQPGSEILAKTASECNLIIKKFLQNVHDQLNPGTRLCLAVPAWQISPGKFKHLPLIDQLSDLGYNRVDFERVSDKDLLYYREDQIVARELLVLTRK